MNKYDELDDKTLVSMSLLGDGSAYGELVLRHEKRVQNTAYKVTHNTFSAQDAAQDAFVAAWMNLDSLKERGSFSSWVCAIAKNRGCAIMRDCCNIADISFEDLSENEPSDEDTADAAERNEEKSELHKAVESLSDKIRQVVKLHYFEELSVVQIAQRLSLPEGTVKWRLSQGRKKLRGYYGIMDNEYDENEPMLTRVMKKVEQLKLWQLKNDKAGFEAEYRAVLTDVMSLDESADKQSALSEVLMRGYWWLPGERNKQTLAKIKAAAESSHNEDVMQYVIVNEYDEYSGKERVDYIRNVQIPYLKAGGYVKTLAYAWFWLGYYSMDDDCVKPETCEAFEEVLRLLTPADVYYANAVAALKAEKAAAESKQSFDRICLRATGEVLRKIKNKLYFWEQPGYSRGGGEDFDSSLLWNASQCDSLLSDPDMKPGESRLSSGGKLRLCCEAAGVSVKTPAGVFDNCVVNTLSAQTGSSYGLQYSSTVFCPGVGIVKQTVKRHGDESVWLLKSYTVKGGSGYLPLCAGNKWAYAPQTGSGIEYECENVFEVTYSDSDRTVLYNSALARAVGYDVESWKGNILYARHEYVIRKDGEHLRDVSAAVKRAGELAVTKRQKAHTAQAADVMRRIFDTDPEYNPGYTQKGCWNFFNVFTVSAENGKTSLDGDYRYSFEWKDLGGWGQDNSKLLYNFVYDIINDATGCIWSEDWVDGYEYKSDKTRHGDGVSIDLRVYGGQSVSTPAGDFDGCQRVSYTLTGLTGGLAYRGGRMDYTYAPGVGIVKFETMFSGDVPACTYALTEYKGTGEGFFPVGDGMARKYELLNPAPGFVGSVTYTYDTDEKGTVIFRNATGICSRAAYEALQKKD